MIVETAKKVIVGIQEAKKVYLGSKPIWFQSIKYLQIDPQKVWIDTEPVDVNIISNTEWQIK